MVLYKLINKKNGLFYTLLLFLLVTFLHFCYNQTSESEDKPPPPINASLPSINRTRIILFWNTYWEDGYYGYHIGKGYEPFQTCLHKNCYSTKNRSVLYDPNYIVDGIVFYRIQCPMDDLKKIRQFKESEKLVEQKNQGIKPKLIFFDNVRFPTLFKGPVM